MKGLGISFSIEPGSYTCNPSTGEQEQEEVQSQPGPDYVGNSNTVMAPQCDFVQNQKHEKQTEYHLIQQSSYWENGQGRKPVSESYLHCHRRGDLPSQNA